MQISKSNTYNLRAQILIYNHLKCYVLAKDMAFLKLVFFLNEDKMKIRHLLTIW